MSGGADGARPAAQNDLDLGASGAIVIKDNHIITGGKQGPLYIANAANLGGYDPNANNTNAFQARPARRPHLAPEATLMRARPAGRACCCALYRLGAPLLARRGRPAQPLSARAHCRCSTRRRSTRPTPPGSPSTAAPPTGPATAARSSRAAAAPTRPCTGARPAARAGGRLPAPMLRARCRACLLRQHAPAADGAAAGRARRYAWDGAAGKLSPTPTASAEKAVGLFSSRASNPVVQAASADATEAVLWEVRRCAACAQVLMCAARRAPACRMERGGRRLCMVC